MNCNKCGFLLKEEDQVCPNCGEPLTALSHNEVVMQDVPEKVENTSVQESNPVPQESPFVETPNPSEPVVPTTPIVEPTPVTPSEPVINEPTVSEPIANSAPTMEAPVVETPVTGTVTNAQTVETKKKNNAALPILIFSLALLVVGVGIFFGLKYFSKKTPEPTPVKEEKEEEKVIEKYYPIDTATGNQIISEYDNYRIQAKELTKGNFEAYKSKLKLEATKVTVTDTSFRAEYTEKIADKKDAITLITVNSKNDNIIETEMYINVYTEERVKEILKAFYDLYSPGATVEEYTENGLYKGGYKIVCPNNITMIIGYIEVDLTAKSSSETENSKIYYKINIIESI